MNPCKPHSQTWATITYFATLYENTITREDYAFIKLKFDVIEPTMQQLQTENRLHKLGIIPDEYPDIN